MLKRFNNGLGIVILVAVMAVTPLVPAAVSAPAPDWKWDSQGRVYDASGNYRSLSDEEACRMYGMCKGPGASDPADSTQTDGFLFWFAGAGGDSGGGCR